MNNVNVDPSQSGILCKDQFMAEWPNIPAANTKISSHNQLWELGRLTFLAERERQWQVDRTGPYGSAGGEFTRR